MYTNDAKALGYELSRDVSHPMAIQQEPAAVQKIEPQAVGMKISQELGVGQTVSLRQRSAISDGGGGVELEAN